MYYALMPSSWALAVFSFLIVPAVDALRIDVPLHFDSAGRYVMGVSMSEGTGRQNFSYTFSTGTGNVYAAGCGGTLVAGKNAPLYNQTMSTTAHILGDQPDADVLGQAVGATIVKETCSIVGAGNSLFPYGNQTIFVVKNTTQNSLTQAAQVALGTEVSGIIGLGTNRVPKKTAEFCGTLEDSIIGQWLLQYPQFSNFSFGMAVGSPVMVPRQDGDAASVPPSSVGTDAGIIHLIQPDPSHYITDKVSWVNANATAGPSNGSIPSSDWTVILDGWVASTQSNQLSSKGQIVADLDPLYAGIYVPQDQAALIHASIPGASLQKGLSSLGNLSMAYTVPCDAQFTFGVVVGGQTFYVDHSNLIITLGDGRCASSIEAWTDSSETQYVLGSRFLCTLYLIFNVPRNGSQQIGVSPRADGSDKAPLDVKAIVGGTVGGAALIIFTVLGGLYFCKHWKSPMPRSDVPVLPSASEYEEAAKTPKSGWHIQPFTMMSPTSQTMAQQQLSPQSTSPTGYGPLSQSSAGHSASPPPSPVIVIGDRRSIDVAPPSYRAHDSYLGNLPQSSPGTIQSSQSLGGLSEGTARATCGGKGSRS